MTKDIRQVVMSGARIGLAWLVCVSARAASSRTPELPRTIRASDGSVHVQGGS